MKIATGKFDVPALHHKGWFRVFRFDRAVEIWVGSRWVMIHL